MPTEHKLSDSILTASFFNPTELTFEASDFTISRSLSYNSNFSLVKADLPTKYIINDKVTVLIWKDGTKTIVRKTAEDEFNPRLAFLTAFFQHYSGLSKNKANKYLANLQVEKPKKPKEKKTKHLFNVGDKVIVKKTLNINQVYGDETFVEDMEKYKGKTVTISRITTDGDYFIKEDEECWVWTNEMFAKQKPKHMKEDN